MMERLVTFLLGRAPRERWLLALLVLLILPVTLIFLWLLPQMDARAAAEQNLRTAENLRLWVAERVAEKAALDAALPDTPTGPVAAIGISGIEQSLIAAGLRDAVTRLANRDSGGVELGFDVVEFRALSDWLETQTTAWGYQIDAFRFDATDTPGSVAATFLLEPAR